MLNPITPDPEPTDAELTAHMKDVPERLPDRARRWDLLSFGGK